MKPLLKWVGGKTQLLPELLKHLPDMDTFHGVYYEPFAGGAALYWHLADNLNRVWQARLSDTNAKLINVYRQVAAKPSVVAEKLEILDRYRRDENDRVAFLTARGMLNHPDNAGEGALLAAAFIAVNKLGFNGLWRVNKKGLCNVPPGTFKKPPTLPTREELEVRARVCLRDDIRVLSFENAMFTAGAGDVVYCDPPYVPASTTADFTGYTSDGFGMAQQAALRDAAVRCAQRGAHVILSNSDTPLVRALYTPDRFELHPVRARRAINCKAGKRGAVGELIIVGRKGGFIDFICPDVRHQNALNFNPKV